MATPTVPVTVTLASQDGTPYVGITVRARLDKNDVYQGMVISDPSEGVTDENGEAVLNCFPNAPDPIGFGTQGTTYRFTASIPNARSLNVLATVPNEACRLENILVDSEPVTLSAAQLALAQAQTAVTTAASSAADAEANRALTALDRIATGEDRAATAADRIATGQDRQVVEGIAAEYGSLTEAIEATQQSASDANESAQATAADRVQTGLDVVAATIAKAEAEAARDAALAAARIKPDTAAGLIAYPTSGDYFYVPSAVTTESLILYMNNAGVALEVKRYLSAGLLDTAVPVDFVWAVTDDGGRAAMGVKSDGTVAVDTLEVAEATVETLSADELAAGGASIEDQPVIGYAWAVTDGEGHVPLGIKDDGTVAADEMEVENLTVSTINGEVPGTGTVARRGGIYSHQINYINNTGQSLGEGSTEPGGAASISLTTTQEYDNLGFGARASAPTAFVTLTTANTAAGTRGESPMYGTLGHIKELIAKENGITYTQNDYQLVTCNNAYSASSITTLNKGTARYDLVLSQIQAAYDIATADGKTMSYQAFTWTQGENDNGMLKATYKAHLAQLVEDYNTDGKAITGQFNDVRCITYQCSTGVNQTIALAQLELSNEHPLVTMACPMYQFEYGDTLHITAQSSKWLGGYYGLAYKRTIIDGDKNWKPLQPVGHAVLGSTIDLIFNRTGLVLDTTAVPAQTDYGFTVKNASAVAQTITSVAILSPNRVRITVSGTPAAGWTVGYGRNTATGRTDAYTGGCGNLRDSQGDTLVYEAISKPMHNWCVIFDYTI